MSILVTGGSGFIGSHIVDVLHEQGFSVINLDIRPPHREDITYIKGSILEKGLINSIVQKCDVVFHIGGFSNINFVKNNPVETIELNVLSTAYLLDACRKRTVPSHFIYASSVYVFDRKGHLYTTSKSSSERIVEDFNNLYNVPYTILRYATVYGPRNREADVIYLFVKKAVEGGLIEIQGDGSQKRNFTHVRDIAEGSVKVLNQNESINKTLTIASSQTLSIKELALKVKELVNPKCKIIYKAEERHLDYEGEIKGIDETYRILNWRPIKDIDAGITELAELI